VGGSDIATFRSDDFATGGFAVLLRDGQAAVQSANALVTVAEPGRGGSSWLRARDYWLSVPLLLLLALGAGGLVAYVLASWFANDASPMLRYTLTLSLYAWMAVTVLRLWINRRPPELFGYHPDFALWCGAIVAAAGVYLWLAGQWPHLKRRLPALILLTLAIPPCVEKAVRLSPLKWTWEADFQGGYIRDQYLVRPILGPLMWMTASGDYQARNRPARPRNHPDTANPEAIRVVTLGASSTYGSGVMEAKDAWPSVMEGMLQESAGDGVSVEVFNFGYPSLTSFDDVMFLERDLLSLEPDVVTISVTGNEAICPHGNPPPQQDEWDSHNALSPLQKRLRHNILSLRTLVGFNHWLNDALTPVEDTHTEEQHPPEDFRATLNQLCDLAEEHGFRVVLIAEPIWERMLFADSYHQPWVDVMNEVSEARGVALVDPVPDFAAHLADAMWATWIHPTVMGNRVMAGAVTPTVASAIGEARRGADQAP
jgi:lysophospholipase L1-like esterase